MARVLLFGPLRDLAGWREREFPAATLSDLRRTVGAEDPALAKKCRVGYGFDEGENAPFLGPLVSEAAAQRSAAKRQAVAPCAAEGEPKAERSASASPPS